MTSRGLLAVIASSMVLAPQLSQGKGARPHAAAGSGSGSGSAEPASHDDDDDEGGSGSGVKLVAPPDAKLRPAWLKEKLLAAVASQPKLARAKLAAAIVDLTTGEELWAHDADKPMNLASNAKLLTSIAALGTLGSGFRWHTTVYADKLDDATGTVAGDLYIRGKGDPMLSAADLRALAGEVAARGVRTVEGRLVIDGGYFDDAVEPPHYDEQKAERAAFRAPIASFGVSRSSITIVVIAEPGGGATVKLEPDAGDYVKIVKDEVVSVTEGRTRIRVDSIPKRDHLELKISGQIRAAEGAYEVRKRIDDPTRFAAEVLRRALDAQGVRVRGRSIGSGVPPTTAKVIAMHESPTLADTLRAMNKWSDNYVAESVLKTLGAETRTAPGPATWADGTAAVRAYLAKIGLPPTTYRADNGSGLFGASEVSAHQLTTILRAAHKDYRIGPDLLASLPVGGVDGTLAKRWHGRIAKGRVRAKTGTLEKVATLAGYVGYDSGHPLAFAILVNDIPPGQRPAAKGVADDMIDALVAYLAP